MNSMIETSNNTRLWCSSDVHHIELTINVLKEWSVSNVKRSHPSWEAFRIIIRQLRQELLRLVKSRKYQNHVEMIPIKKREYGEGAESVAPPKLLKMCSFTSLSSSGGLEIRHLLKLLSAVCWSTMYLSLMTKGKNGDDRAVIEAPNRIEWSHPQKCASSPAPPPPRPKKKKTRIKLHYETHWHDSLESKFVTLDEIVH